MNRNYKFPAILLIGLILIFAPNIARAQADESNYAFVVFETAVTQKGLETSRPTLFYHEPGKPLYGEKMQQKETTKPATVVKSKKV